MEKEKELHLLSQRVRVKGLKKLKSVGRRNTNKDRERDSGRKREEDR